MSETQHTFLHFFRRRLMTPIAIAVILLRTLLVGLYDYDTVCNNCLKQLESSAMTARSNYAFEGELQQTVYTLADRIFSVRLDIVKTNLADGKSIAEALSAAQAYGTETVQLIFLCTDGTVISPAGCELPPLTEEEWAYLRQTGANDSCSLARIDGVGELLAYWPDALVTDGKIIQIIPEICEKDILVFDADSGEKLFASEGITCDAISDLSLTPCTSFDASLAAGSTAYRYSIKGGGFWQRGIAVKCEADDGTAFFALEDNSHLMRSLLVRLLPSVLLITIFYFIMLKACFRYREMWKSGALRSDLILRIGKYRLDRKLLKPILSLILLGFTIILVNACLMQTLSLMTETNATATNVLQHISALKDFYSDTKSYMDEAYLETSERTTNYIVDLFAQDNSLLSHDKLKDLASRLIIVRIDVYDKNGVIVASSSDYTGYTLSSIPADPESSLWPVLNGETQYMSLSAGSGSGIYYAAAKRKDGVGMVRLTLSTNYLSNLYDSFGTDSLFRHSDTAGSDVILIDRSDPEYYYYYDNAASTVARRLNDLPESALQDDFVSTLKLNGQTWTACSLVTDDMIVLCLNQATSYLPQYVFNLISFVVCCLLVMLLILSGTAVYTDDTLSAAPPVSDNTVVPGFQQKMLLTFINLSFGFAFLFYLLDWLFGTHPVIPFLLERSWSYGLHFYSIICAVTDLVVAGVVCMVYRFFYNQLAAWLPPRSHTIVRLVYSVLNVVTVAIALVLALRQIGIDMTTILGGLGLTGLALSLGAQSTLADLIAGISLILDRHVQIGDFVSVGDFEGVIIDMNICNTKIKLGKYVRSVRNSSMVNVSRTVAVNGGIPVSVSFVIPYSVPQEKVAAAIKGGEARFAAAYPGIFIGGIDYCTLQSFKDNGAEYKLVLRCIPEKRNRAKSTMYSVIKSLLEENDIPVAEPVVRVR